MTPDTGYVIEPIADERTWFKILPTVQSLDHFAEHAGEKAATFVAECFRAHLAGDFAHATNAQIFGVVMRCIRNGEVEAFVRLHDGNPQARFSFPFDGPETMQ